MATAQLIRCACGHCSCSFDADKGYLYEGKVYCSEACAIHDHAHPSECCSGADCCQ